MFKFDRDAADLPGRIVVLPSGDEGSLPNHSKASFDALSATQIGHDCRDDGGRAVPGETAEDSPTSNHPPGLPTTK